MKKFEDFFIILYYLHKSQGHTKLASKAEWYTLCRFAPQNRLLGEAPNPPNSSVPELAARSPGTLLIGRWPMEWSELRLR